MNEIESNRLYIIYRGFLDSLEIIKVRFDICETNKSRKFYSRMKNFLYDLVEALNLHIPNLDFEIK